MATRSAKKRRVTEEKLNEQMKALPRNVDRVAAARRAHAAAGKRHDRRDLTFDEQAEARAEIEEVLRRKGIELQRLDEPHLSWEDR